MEVPHWFKIRSEVSPYSSLRSKIFHIWSAKVIYKDDSFSFDSELPAFQLIPIEFFPLFCWIFLFSWK